MVPGLIIFLAEQPHANARPNASAATLALVGRRTRHGLDRQSLGLAARRVAADACRARIDHETNSRHRQRRLGHVCGNHDAPFRARLKHPLLFANRQPSIERQNLRLAAHRIARQRPAAKSFRRLMDIALGRHEDQNVTAIDGRHFFNGRQHRFLQVELVAVFVGHRRPPANVNRIRSPRNLNHRCGPIGRSEVRAKPRRVDRRRRDNQLQIPPLRQQTFEISDQKIDIQRPLVGFVQNDRVVLVQICVALRFGQQNPIGHQFDIGLWRKRLGKPNLEPHVTPQWRGQFLGNPRRNASSSDSPRLRMTDEAVDPTA